MYGLVCPPSVTNRIWAGRLQAQGSRPSCNLVCSAAPSQQPVPKLVQPVRPSTSEPIREVDVDVVSSAPSTSGSAPEVAAQGKSVVQFEAAVKGATELQQLAGLFKQTRDQLTGPELILICNQLAKVSDASKMTVRMWSDTQAFLHDLLLMLDNKLPDLTKYEYVVLLAALARLRHTPSQEWLSRFYTLSQSKLPSCNPSHLTVLLRALTQLEMQPWDVKATPGFSAWMHVFLNTSAQKMNNFRADELIRTISAMGDLCYRPPSEWMMAFSRSLKAKLDYMEPPLLTRGMLAFATLKYEPDSSFVKAYYTQLYSKLPMFDDWDLATVAQAFVVLRRIVKQEFLNEFLDEVLLKVNTFTPTAMANLLVALAGLSNGSFSNNEKVTCEVPKQWLEAVGKRLHERMWNFGGNSLANALWGLSELGYRPKQDLLDHCVACSLSKLHTMRTTELVRMLEALGTFAYLPASDDKQQLFQKWFAEYMKLAAKRRYNARNACDLVGAVIGLPNSSSLLEPGFITTIIRATQIHNLRNANAARLVRLLKGLQQLGYRPDFGFLHNFAQAARYMWTSFKPQELADLMYCLSEFGCPVTLDPLWSTEFMALVQTRFDEFPPQALATLLQAVVRLPGLKPSAQWLAMAVARVQQASPDFSASQMCDVLVALSQLGYRPPADVLDTFLHHISAHAEELPPSQTAQISAALTHLVPGYLANEDGHQQYHNLQIRLRKLQLPSRVHLQQVPEPARGAQEPGPEGPAVLATSTASEMQGGDEGGMTKGASVTVAGSGGGLPGASVNGHYVRGGGSETAVCGQGPTPVVNGMMASTLGGKVRVTA
mmetsp:Transcript_4997/g.10788  ORF Transcript_4997/g.10788 Transcript_4997/m.10788 type:complete len:828 (-) Transcript_4997:399-2882(-)